MNCASTMPCMYDWVPKPSLEGDAVQRQRKFLSRRTFTVAWNLGWQNVRGHGVISDLGSLYPSAIESVIVTNDWFKILPVNNFLVPWILEPKAADKEYRGSKFLPTAKILKKIFVSSMTRCFTVLGSLKSSHSLWQRRMVFLGKASCPLWTSVLISVLWLKTYGCIYLLWNCSVSPWHSPSDRWLDAPSASYGLTLVLPWNAFQAIFLFLSFQIPAI